MNQITYPTKAEIEASLKVESVTITVGGFRGGNRESSGIESFWGANVNRFRATRNDSPIPFFWAKKY